MKDLCIEAAKRKKADKKIHGYWRKDSQPVKLSCNLKRSVWRVK